MHWHILQGFDTIQVTTEEETDADNILKRHATNVQLDIDPLSKLYAKAAHEHMMTFHDYCSRVQSLNTKEHEIVMYNRAWCKSYIDGMQHGQKLHGYRVFLSGSVGTGKSQVLQLIQQDICYMLNHTINPDDDQPLVLVTAPTGSAAFQVRWINYPFSIAALWQVKNQTKLGKAFHHAIEITQIDVINHRWNQHGKFQTVSADEWNNVHS